MIELSREERVNNAFVEMASTLVNDYDVVDLLSTLVHICTDLLSVEAGGILLADVAGNLELVASTSEEAEVVEIMVIAAGAGPCIDCYKTGSAISVPDLNNEGMAWPRFRGIALNQGFKSAHVTPLRLHGEVIGAMNLMGAAAQPMSERDVQLAQALADVATIGILHERNLHQPGVVSTQLNLALDTRILVEQAKGVLVQHHPFTMTEAFTSLRGYAKSNTMTLRAISEEVIAGTIPVERVVVRAREG